MPTTDEDLLIDAAIGQRKSQKRGADLLATLTVAAVFAAVGWFLVFWLRPLIKSVPFLPLGTVTTSMLVIGVIAFAIAGLLIAGALLFANPLARWGDAVPGTCPLCGKRALRQEKVEYTGWEEGHPEAGIKKGPRGLVTLCATPGCPYAAATVTTARSGGLPGVEGRPANLGPPRGLVGGVLTADEVVLPDRAVHLQRVACHVGG
jgi:hypothetical protein